MSFVQSISDDMKVMLGICRHMQRLSVPRTVTSRVTTLSQEDQRRCTATSVVMPIPK